jgi:hypothetical protein
MTVTYTMASGKRGGGMDMVYSQAVTAKYMLESIDMIRRVDMVNTHSLLVPNMLASIKTGNGADMVNTHTVVVPNMLESSKINIGAWVPSLITKEMCTAESGSLESLSRASSPGTVNPGMAVVRRCMAAFNNVSQCITVP